MRKNDSFVTPSHDALLKALESARVATVDVARFSGCISPHVADAAETLLNEISSLLAAVRSLSVLGDDRENRPVAMKVASGG